MRIYDSARAEYNNRTPEKGCPFCDQLVIDKQECTKFSFKHWLVLVNKHPYMNGNVMLVTKRHIESINELSESEWVEFSHALQEVQSALTEMFHTESFNIGINIGEESGRSIPHLHWQVIPRKRKNHSVVSVLADIQVITLSAEDLKKSLSV